MLVVLCGRKPHLYPPSSLKKLEALAERILSDCNTHSPTLDQLEERLQEFEGSCSSLTPEEAAKIAGDIQTEIKVWTF